MTRLIYLFFIPALLLPKAADAFIDPPELDPNPAQAGESVVLLMRTGVEDGVLGGENNPAITVNGQEIDVLIDGVRDDPLGVKFPIVDHEFSLGVFPPGEYIVTVRFRYEPLFSPPQIEILGVLPLTVEAPPIPRAVPAGNWLGFGLLIILIAAIGVFAIHNKNRVLLGLIPVLLLFAHLPDASAQLVEEQTRLYVLLANTPDAPSPQEIVENNDLSATAPIFGLGVGNPVTASYLLPFRADGDLKLRLEADPEAPRAKLERYIVVKYPSAADASLAINALAADPNVEAVSKPMMFETSAGGGSGAAPAGYWDAGTDNYGWSAINVGGAWELAGGHSLVGVIDVGLEPEHQELLVFDEGVFKQGNFLASLSADMGPWPDAGDLNVDEREPEVVQNPDQSCPTGPNGVAPADFVGHGTHVAGLIGANPYDGNNVTGTCKHCGISMWRTAKLTCVVGYGIQPALSAGAIAVSITALGDIGAQVINMSFGEDHVSTNPCGSSNAGPFCDALAYVQSRGVVPVASSGNGRRKLDFPARDGRVIAAGGFDEQLLLWDEMRETNNSADCPVPGDTSQCGSNYTFPGSQPKQEVVSGARQISGVMYRGFDWNSPISCGDSFGGGASDDGYGTCTGTSMSAPQISGLFGILRSVNPLVPAGDPENSGTTGVRDVLTSTTFQAQAGQPWERRLGYGRPDAAAAVRKMLGTVAGETVRNRVTPLFGLYNSVTGDHAFTTSPQLAMGLIGNQKHSYAPVGGAIPGYSEFPDPMLQGHEPLASTFVLTTEYKVDPRHPNLVPLYLFSFSRPHPVTSAAGCTPGQPGCVTKPEGFVMVTTVAEVEWLHDEGLHYWGVEGYVYESCDHIQNPGCVPQGAQPLYRQCKNKSTNPDCAIFLESERNAFEANGYLTAFPPTFPTHIGYAYPNVDTDGDALIDGFEYLIGTDPTLVDTDGDGSNDGVEFPMASVALSDPCDGPMSHRCRINRIFANRFEDGPYTGPGAGGPGPLNVPEACAQADTQLTEYESRLAERESELEEGAGPAWQEHMEEVAAVEEVRDSLSEYCDW